MLQRYVRLSSVTDVGYFS